MPPLNRRRFLGQASCAAISSLPILNTLLNLKLTGSVAAATPSSTDYRALVCIFLSGGADTFNLVIPRDNTGYAQYQAVRGPVALPQSSLQPINPIGLTGLQLGLHPGFVGLASLFEAGKAAIVTNVGTLVQPVTLADFNNNDLPLPLNLFSHADQQEQWQTSTPDIRSAVGWGGRLADLIQSVNANPTVSMNISLTGQNIYQSGNSAFAYTVNSDGAVPLNGYDPTNTNPYSTVPILTQAVDSQMALTYQSLLTTAFANQKQNAMSAYTLFNAATGAVTLPTSVVFPATDLASQLQMVARTIAGHAALGQSRQTFFIEFDGWDHHDNLVAQQAAMVPILDGALAAFYSCLAALGLDSNVTTFTASDFSRTLTSDGGGTDHAWGANHFVVGGAVNGQQLYGTFPQLYANNPLDVGRGRLIPQIPVDSYFAELALWLGVSKSDLSQVLPNIGTFYDTTSSSTPLGLMTA